MMLKDYLGRDMSSCSSSGFQSLPRRQCCPSLKFLLDSDIRYPNKHLPAVPAFDRPHSRDHVSSAIQRAAHAVNKVIKLISFPSSPPSSSSAQLTTQRKQSTFHVLRRGISGKLFRRRASMKRRVETQGKEMAARLVTYLQVESPRSSSVLQLPPWPNDATIGNVESADVAPDVSTLGRRGGSDEVSVEKVDTPEASVGGDGEDRVAGAATRGSSMEVWPRENKEQCSPVSVLDCPFDDEEGTSSPLNCNAIPLSGNTKNLKGKFRRNEKSVPLVEPVDLLQQYAHPDSKNTTELISRTVRLRGYGNAREIISQEIQKLAPVSKVDKLLLEHLVTEIGNGGARLRHFDPFYERNLALALDWFYSKPNDITLGWNVDEGRRAYLRDMEWNGEWMTLEEEKANVARELECDAFKTLLEESIADFIVVR